MPSPKTVGPRGAGLRGADRSRISMLFGGALGKIFQARPLVDFGGTEMKILDTLGTNNLGIDPMGCCGKPNWHEDFMPNVEFSF
jgi:hypothetical protein